MYAQLCAACSMASRETLLPRNVGILSNLTRTPICSVQCQIPQPCRVGSLKKISTSMLKHSSAQVFVVASTGIATSTVTGNCLHHSAGGRSPCQHYSCGETRTRH